MDILSSLEFNDTGQYLAAGDNGGRVVIFQQGHLNSTEIQERINVIQWIPLNPSNLSLLSTNGCFLLLLVINR